MASKKKPTRRGHVTDVDAKKKGRAPRDAAARREARIATKRSAMSNRAKANGIVPMEDVTPEVIEVPSVLDDDTFGAYNPVLADALDALLPMQRRFCEEYAIDLAVGAAAMRAGYSPNSAHAQGSTLLKHPKVRRAVELLIEERSKLTGITAARVLLELAALGFSNINDYDMNEYGDIKLRDGVSSRAWRAISSIKRRVTYDRLGSPTHEAEIKLWDKPAALKMLATHTGAVVKRIELTGKDGSPIQSDVRIGLSPEVANDIRASVLGIKVDSVKPDNEIPTMLADEPQTESDDE